MDKTAVRIKATKWRKIIAPDSGDIFYIPVSGANVADQFKHYPNPGDHVHVSRFEDRERYENKDRSAFRGLGEGYGGSTLEFPLEDGTIDHVKGPWHTYTDALDRRTGIRITDLHYTFVTIATATKPDGFMEVDPDSIIYQDPGWVLGPFMRGERLARQLADALNLKVYKLSESMGGASTGWFEPGGDMHPMAKRAGE